MHRTISERLKKIQEHLGVEPDGVLGGQTLSALLSLSDMANSVKAIKRQLELVEQYELDIKHNQALFSSQIS